ncbi:MAG: TIM barrel protein, partial [Gracilimonas sp.]
MISRSDFLKSVSATGFGFFGVLNFNSAEKLTGKALTPKYSLSQFALHKAIWGKSRDNYSQWEHNLRTNPDLNLQGDLHPLDFPAKAKELGFEAVDYVSSIIFNYADEHSLLKELKNRTTSEGISNQFIAVGELGMIGDPDLQKRKQAIENHFKWMDAAKYLGCHSIRADAHSTGPWKEQVKLASEGVYKLAEKAEEIGVDLMLENHGGMSCNADWLVEVIEKVNHP